MVASPDEIANALQDVEKRLFWDSTINSAKKTTDADFPMSVSTKLNPLQQAKVSFVFFGPKEL